MKIIILLVAFLCFSCVSSQVVPRPPVTTNTQAAAAAQLVVKQAAANARPVVTPAPSFALRDANGRFLPRRPTITPQQEAAINRQIKYDRKDAQRATEPTNQATFNRRQLADAAKDLTGKNKQQVAAQIVDIQKNVALRQEKIAQLQKVIQAREPAKLIPYGADDNSGALAAGKVKMNLLSKMNSAESLKVEMGADAFNKLVAEQAADVQKLKDLAKLSGSNSAGNFLYYTPFGSSGFWSATPRDSTSRLAATSKAEFNRYFVEAARKIQENENSRMQAVVNNHEYQNKYFADKINALKTVTNNPNSPLANEANFDEVELDGADARHELDEATLDEAEFDSIPTNEIITPRQAFHQHKHGKVSVDVEVQV